MEARVQRLRQQHTCGQDYVCPCLHCLGDNAAIEFEGLHCAYAKRLFMAWQSAQMDMPNGGKGTSVRDHKKSLYVDILILKGIAMETDPSGINTCCSRGPLQQRMRQSNELQRGGLIPA